MSFDAIAWSWRQEVPPTARLVLVNLCCRVGMDGRCWPSQETIARDTGLSTRAVFDALKLLEGEHKIRRTRRAHAGVRTSDLIEILFSRTVLFEDGPVADAEPTKNANRPDPLLASPAGSHSRLAPKSPAPAASESPAESPEGESPESPLPPKISEKAAKVAATIWREAHPACRRRSQGEGALAAAVAAELQAGADPEDLLAAFAALATDPDTLAEDGKYAKGLHRLFEAEAWRRWLPPPKSRLEQAIERAAKVLFRVVVIDRVSRWRAGDDWEDPHSAPPDHPDCRYRDLVCVRPPEAFAAWRQRRAAGEREVLTGERSACVALVQRTDAVRETWKINPLGVIAAIEPLIEAWEYAWAVSQPVKPAWAELEAA